jgi:hypothetical protein
MMAETTIGAFVLGLIVGMALVRGYQRVKRELRRGVQVTARDEADDALVVAFLRSRGASRMISIQTGMEDFTQGEHDWYPHEKRLYASLRRLGANGTISKRKDGIGKWEYSLVAPVSSLVDVDPV